MLQRVKQHQLFSGGDSMSLRSVKDSWLTALEFLMCVCGCMHECKAVLL